MRSRAKKTVPEKAKTISWGLLIVFGVILLRIWVLAVLLHDQKMHEARRPQKRRMVEKAERACICDRFGELLAANHVQYNAGVCYGHLRQIPRLVTKKCGNRKIKTYPRKEYIIALSQLLSNELGLDAERIEDLFYSKAAILGNAPCLLKENIAEATYFRLKMLEKDWPGLVTEVTAKRVYPKGALASEIIGYIGPISREKYEAVLEEMKLLRDALVEDPSQSELQERLGELERLSYTINDLTGKVGIEATCDALLRGQIGKRIFLTDIKGDSLGELDESTVPIAGKQITLTISSELQDYCERLLAEYSQESTNQALSAAARRLPQPKQRPWLKEGAIVVMEPKTGDILALASFPRSNPNDFIPSSDPEENGSKQWRVRRSLETNEYLGGVWDQKVPLVREVFDVKQGAFVEQACWLDWTSFLNMIISQQSPLLEKFQSFDSVTHSIFLQQAAEMLFEVFQPLSPRTIIDLLYSSDEHAKTGLLVTLQEKDFFAAQFQEHEEKIRQLERLLTPYFSQISDNMDKLLFLDLNRLVVDAKRFTSPLVQACGKLSLGRYRELAGQFATLQTAVKDIVRDQFHTTEFKAWRAHCFKNFLAKKRREEKLAGRKYAKPYLDYLDAEEQEQFETFWQAHRLDLLLCFLQGKELSGSLESFISELRAWHDELRAGAHHALEWHEAFVSLSTYLQELEPSLVMPFLKTLRPFEELERPLYGFYPNLRCDELTGERKECHLAMGFYPRYGYGYLRSHAFRQAATMGSLFKLIPAYAALVQMHQEGKGPPYNPLTIIDDKHRTSNRQGGWNVGFFADGRPIPLHYHGGRLPKTDHAGVGRIDVTKALEASSNPYFALLAGEILHDPEDLCDAARLFGFGEKSGIDLVGEFGGNIPKDVAYNRTGLYSMAIGQHTLLVTPLQAASMLSSIVNGGRVLKPRLILDEPVICRWNILLPEEVKRPLLEGMRRVMMGDQGAGRFVRNQYPSALVSQVIGKTSTAEMIENFGCDHLSKQVKTKAIWFGSILFDPKDGGKMNDPELVIVVYLKQGEYGRYAIPYGLKVAQKWREIKARQ